MNCPCITVLCLQFLVLSLQFLPLGFPRLNELSLCITVLRLRFLILISECIKYKVACMCFSAVGGSGLAYLSELLHVYSPSRTLCSSSDTHMLEIQQYKRKTHGFRTFSCFGPHICNSLPQDLRHCLTLSSFKAKLKTFLFSQYFRPNISTQFLPQSVCV